MLTRDRARRLPLVLLRQHRWAFLADAAIGAAFFLVGIIPGLIAKQVLDRLAAPEGETLAIWLIVALMLVKAVHVGLGIGWMAADTALRGVLLALLRQNLFDRIMSLPAARALPTPVGDALNRFMEDVREVVEALCKRGGLTNLTSSLSFTTVAVAVMVHINLRVTVLVLLPVLGVILISYSAGQRINRFRRRSRQAAGEVSGFLQEIFANIQLIKLSGAQSHVIARLVQHNRVRRQAAVRDNVFVAVLHSSSAFVLALGVGLILLVSTDDFRQGDFTVGDLALFTYLLQEVGIGVVVLGDFLRQWRQARVSAERLAALQQGEHIAELGRRRPLYLRGGPPEATADKHPGSSADELRQLEIRGLSYRYGPDGFALRDVDLALVRGSMTVITGQVGSGKSTLVQCLLGMLPADAGTVYWNGEPIADPASFLKPPRCAYLPQNPQFFSDTVRQNILLGLPSDGDIERDAAYRAVFEQDLAAMPEGFDTAVGPRGYLLSGGQRHRLAAARMLAREADLLVIDDVSAALDVQTETVLWDRLITSAQASGQTLLIVTNKLPTLMRADIVVMLEAGQVVGTGEFLPLLVDCPPLRQLHPELRSGDALP
ncbi:MAG TPA: ABC transporter ATP-binding protein [Jatrophihabitans sp.]|jgi:ATP-binding cassette subfamily B protein|uniref:ABC transporter ATP-binding protein n=1 Tax=Jatrophihabitans sp. TaxID=1932789 RepID=UPI002EDD5A6F